MIRVKLYELLVLIVKLNYTIINASIAKLETLLNQIVVDYETFDTNSSILGVLNNLIEAIIWQTTSDSLRDNFLKQQKLFQRLAQKLSLSEYTFKPNTRKEIFAFIHSITSKLYQELNSPNQAENEAVKKLFAEEPAWQVLTAATQADAERNLLDKQWGEVPIETKVSVKDQNHSIKKHEPNADKNAALIAGAPATGTTTRKIIHNSIAANSRLQKLDDDI